MSLYRWKLTAAVEFNILADPEAADIVSFVSNIPIIMSGLDVTYKAQIRHREIEKIKAQGGKVAVLLRTFRIFYKVSQRDVGWDFAPLHDPCAIACLIKPDMFKFKDLYVEIDKDGDIRYCMKVTDFNNVLGKSPNVKVLLDVD